MVKITKEMVIEIHEDLIARGGHTHGVLCDATLDYILDRIETANGVYAKAAWALYMSRQHPFLMATSERPSWLPIPFLESMAII